MKHDNSLLTPARIEAVIDKLGGEDGAMRFLRGKTEVVERYKPSLIYLFGKLGLDTVYHINHNITPEHFPLEEIRPKSDEDYKVFGSSSATYENVLTQMCDEGYSPANLYELLSWNVNSWKGGYMIIVALGSSIGVDDCSFPALYVTNDGANSLGLTNFQGNGSRTCGLNRFLGVRKPGC